MPVPKPKPEIKIPSSVTYVEWDAPVFTNPDPNRPNATNKAFENHIKGLDRGQIALCAGQYACFASAQDPEIRFEEKPEYGLGREQSRYGVFFGDTIVESEVIPPVRTFVAVKPYDKRVYNKMAAVSQESAEIAPAASLVHDWATALYLNSLSPKTAYKPLGVWKLNDPYFVPALMTAYHERSISFDNIIQEKTEVAGKVTDARLRHIMELGHFGIGFLHGAHLVYRDGIPQNYALDGKRVIINDVTSIRLLNGKDDDKKTQEDVFDFSDGVFDLEHSPRIHDMAMTALRDENHRNKLFGRYLDGYKLGAERSGHTEGGAKVGVDDFHRLIKSVVDKYSKT